MGGGLYGCWAFGRELLDMWVFIPSDVLTNTEGCMQSGFEWVYFARLIFLQKLQYLIELKNV